MWLFLDCDFLSRKKDWSSTFSEIVLISNPLFFFHDGRDRWEAEERNQVGVMATQDESVDGEAGENQERQNRTRKQGTNDH